MFNYGEDHLYIICNVVSVERSGRRKKKGEYHLGMHQHRTTFTVGVMKELVEI